MTPEERTNQLIAKARRTGRSCLRTAMLSYAAAVGNLALIYLQITVTPGGGAKISYWALVFVGLASLNWYMGNVNLGLWRECKQVIRDCENLKF